MSGEYLPIHPITGLRAIGIGKRGPIWPVLGGSEDDTTTEEGTQRTGPTLTHSQSVNRLREVTVELERLQELETLTAEDEAFFQELRDEFFEVDEHRKRLERAAELARVRSVSGQLGQPARQRLHIEAGTPGQGRNDYDRDSIRTRLD